MFCDFREYDLEIDDWDSTYIGYNSTTQEVDYIRSVTLGCGCCTELEYGTIALSELCTDEQSAVLMAYSKWLEKESD